MRIFTWCRQEVAEGCSLVAEHVHIAITSPGGRTIKPKCGRATLALSFQDLDPEKILATEKASKEPDRARELASQCMTEAHGALVIALVEANPGPTVVNCEAGVSRSAGIVLALRTKYGGDTEEVYREAYPNIYVANLLGRILGVGPFKARKYEGIFGK